MHSLCVWTTQVYSSFSSLSLQLLRWAFFCHLSDRISFRPWMQASSRFMYAPVLSPPSRPRSGPPDADIQVQFTKDPHPTAAYVERLRPVLNRQYPGVTFYVL